MISDNIFLELSKKVQNLGFKQSLIEIANIAIDEMCVDKVSVWKFVNEHTIDCQFKGDKQKAEFECGDQINLLQYPTYLKTLQSEKIVIANDVYKSSLTFELNEYFTKHNINSLMDIPIFVDGLLFGIVGFEYSDPHNWTHEDIKFGSDISQIISVAYISSKRNEDLIKLNNYAEKIKLFNNELQELIKKKNEQFIEYGFINSHLLNAPLSRLKGLMNILVIELNGEKREEEIQFLIKKIYEAYDEMDKVVSQITKLINNGSTDIDRNDIIIN